MSVIQIVIRLEKSETRSVTQELGDYSYRLAWESITVTDAVTDANFNFSNSRCDPFATHGRASVLSIEIVVIGGQQSFPRLSFGGDGGGGGGGGGACLFLPCKASSF